MCQSICIKITKPFNLPTYPLSGASVGGAANSCRSKHTSYERCYSNCEDSLAITWRTLQQRPPQLVNYKSIYYALGVIRLHGHWSQSSHQVCKIKRQDDIAAYTLVLPTLPGLKKIIIKKKITWALYKYILSFCTTLFQSFSNQKLNSAVYWKKYMLWSRSYI